MHVDSLADLLRQRRFGQCREAAEALVRQNGLNQRDLARVYLAYSCSLEGLHLPQDALGPGELALHFAHQSRDYDLVGRTLVHLAGLYFGLRLYKRAQTCLEEYFGYYTLYTLGRALEAQVFHHLAQVYHAVGQGSKALEYFHKAYRGSVDQRASAALRDQYRSDLVLQSLKLGQIQYVDRLLDESESYEFAHPEDQDAAVRHLNLLAYRSFVRGNYVIAIDRAAAVMHKPGASALRKGHALLTLHYIAKAVGRPREAIGTGLLARIQASLAKRPDLEDEITRSMLQTQVQEGVPQIGELLVSLKEAVRSAGRTDKEEIEVNKAKIGGK